MCIDCSFRNTAQHSESEICLTANPITTIDPKSQVRTIGALEPLKEMIKSTQVFPLPIPVRVYASHIVPGRQNTQTPIMEKVLPYFD